MAGSAWASEKDKGIVDELKRDVDVEKIFRVMGATHFFAETCYCAETKKAYFCWIASTAESNPGVTLFLLREDRETGSRCYFPPKKESDLEWAIRSNGVGFGLKAFKAGKCEPLSEMDSRRYNPLGKNQKKENEKE